MGDMRCRIVFVCVFATLLEVLNCDEFLIWDSLADYIGLFKMFSRWIFHISTAQIQSL